MLVTAVYREMEELNECHIAIDDDDDGKYHMTDM